MAFDAAAEDYDDAFSRSTLGTLMRRAVWRRLDQRFSAHDRVLELNCGTCEDALHLGSRGVRVLATDRSEAMLAVAGRKVDAAGLRGTIELKRVALEALSSLDASPFDGVLSNFGGLNCVADLRRFGRDLAGLVRPRGSVVLCVMGPVVPWEWCWYLIRGQPRTAFRRLRVGGVDWHGLRVRYPSVGTVRRALLPAFRLRRTGAVGALLPPPYAEEWATRHMRLVTWLDRVERRWESRRVLALLADHYVIELERVGSVRK